MLPPISSKKQGMQDPRWTVKDKITQHKGLVKLFERDAKMLQVERLVTERKQTKEIDQLKRDIVKNKEHLNIAIRGDWQQHRNLLAKHNIFQRTFQDHMPAKTIEYLKQENFNKRKLLDRLLYKTENKLQELTAYKLKCAEMHDSITYPITTKTEEEKMGEIISGKVKQTEIKNEAALQIQSVYKHILDILKKDKMYFDSVLDELMADAQRQSQCIYQVTEIGQLATEYTDDRKHELDQLRHAVKRDMKSRVLQLRLVDNQVKELNNSLKLLVRKESDLNISRVSLAINPLEAQMERDLLGMQTILKDLQDITYVSKFEDILPWLQDQKCKSKQIFSLWQKNKDEKEILVCKINHAKNKYLLLANTTDQSTFGYMENKKTLKHTVEDIQTKVQTLKNVFQEKSTIAAKVRSVLLHLQHMCRIILVPGESDKRTTLAQANIVQSLSSDTVIFAPEQTEMDASQLMADLETRLNILNSAENKYQTDDLKEKEFDVEKYYMKFIKKISRKVSEDDEPIVDALALDIPVADPKLLSYHAIKKESQLIVEQNAKPDWMT